MPLSGLPGVPSGSCSVASGAAVLLCTSGLALLRRTRPNLGEDDLDDEAEGCVDDDSCGNLLGLVGAVQLYAGLVLGELPFILGVSTDNEGKVAALLMNGLILACWLLERFWLTDAPLPQLQTAICIAVGLACSLVDWAGPTPYDDMRLGFASQIAGCDGGFRSPFILYVSVWITGLIFGILLLILEEGSLFMSCGGGTAAGPLRQKALPLVYGLATSMSCVLFATGSASDDMRWVTAGVLLLVVSVLCAWDVLWTLDMNLPTFAALFHGSATGLRAMQNHAVFRDLRWEPDDVSGILAVHEYPGLQIFMFGMLLIFMSLQFYLSTCHWREWRGAADEDLQPYDPVPHKGKLKDEEMLITRGSWWQWLLLAVCVVCQIIGVHVPLIYTECVFPNVTWFRDDPQGYKISQGESYIDLIRWLYERQLPCSALVAAYNAMLLPPLQFLMIFLILLQPKFLPGELCKSMQNYVMTLAPMRFTQPSIMMLVVGIASLPIKNQHRDNIQYGGYFTSGYWFFLTYCITNLILAWSVQPPELPEQAKLHRDPQLQEELKHWHMEDSDSDEAPPSSSPVVGLLMGLAVAGCVAVALTQPYLEFEFRIAGVVIHRAKPTVLDLWYSIGSVNKFLMCFCAATLIVFPLLWLVSLLKRLSQQRLCWEPWLRPLVMCHIWAASLVLIYYIVMARNKNSLEVCATISAPLAVLGIMGMGLGTFTLLHVAKGLQQQPAPRVLPPGGKVLWMGGPALTMLTLGGWLSTCGPVRPQVLHSLQDLNGQFVQLAPLVNEHLYKDVTESFGDCRALWDDQLGVGTVPSRVQRTCSGTTPLFHQEVKMGTFPHLHRIKTEVLWAKGVNSLEVHRLRVQPPKPLGQDWHLNMSAAFNDLHVFMRVLVDDKEWYRGYMCCDQPFHFALQATAQCQPQQGFEAVDLQLVQMDQVSLAHDAAVIQGPAWAAVTSDVGRREMVKKVMEDFLSLHTGQVILGSLSSKSSHARQIAGDVLSDVVRLNTGEICPSTPE